MSDDDRAPRCGFGYFVFALADAEAGPRARPARTLHFWGGQSEAGGVATSYIPTTSAEVTRAADSAVMTGPNLSSWYNAAEGTFGAGDEQTMASTGAALFFNVTDGTDRATETFL